MTAVDDLLDGLAQHAAALGHGVYRRGVPYRPDEVGIVIGGVVPSPGRLVALRTYVGGPEPDFGLPFSEPWVQWRVRGTFDERDSRTRATALYDALHGTGPLRLPNGVLVLSIIAVQAQGPISMGRDEAGRHEHTVNTRVEFWSPSSGRPPL